MKLESETVVGVAVGILLDRSGRVLVCQRPANGRYPLRWEFPGGKAEPGESSADALVRELREELCIRARPGQFLHREIAEYSDGGRFVVEFFVVRSWDGALNPRAFAQVRWLNPEELNKVDLLEGSRAVVALIPRAQTPASAPSISSAT